MRDALDGGSGGRQDRCFSPAMNNFWNVLYLTAVSLCGGNMRIFNPFHVPEWMEGCMWQMSCGMGKLIFIFKVTFLY
ncbi:MULTISPECIES: hypothetical protein [Akkermansia]|uniref:hypothetical protein n=1 Tax=Akkermansia TaxID=239934 RepID=UPI00117A13D2|nr:MULTISPECIES: hypothetical protein [Akkermansia]MBS6356556.1 hypothetical protein [Akkermansia muciniphila]MBT9593396.1 hypothetical protein [Akkermansia muciniphila]MBV4201046.1 hypothetical protein [Akkermansia muciniphila]MCL6680846.1 hypothetical protein [Akkermansia muciniphila]MDT4468912.1 hypothetical protein [Akkermansia muciniphila]